ncbi:ParA family protein [Tessaracoccus flavus]|jgi:cellulose biosynthesis protein BcsQ|uniref:Uncharacterized protein n=1 Tax=Tessaracoccus flavus TaxID=1610493 RepID=A0A1Q2CI78_9ACTN|nr:ParA family protein [Tessaracoccus flavus]AQP45817.1 hypothetical protein RPIT_14225 [Tessaracoccus flavus]SDZ14700.1 Cellulose biosynthesis protein BcsQ [Tessaracoccus flavus]
MAVVVLASATGSPGVTTTALGLALAWPRRVLVADCDRDPSQAVQAGYLRGMDHGGRGLMSLAHLHREGAPLDPEVWRHGLPLVEGGEIERRFLPGFATAGASRLFEHVWRPLGESFGALDTQGADVIVDAGRISTTGLPLGLLAVADTVILCVRSSLRSLAGARIHLTTLQEQLRSLPVPPPAALAVVGSGRPYSGAEIAAQFSLPVVVEPAWDPRGAEVLSDGGQEPRRFSDSPFMGRFRSDAKALSERIARTRQHTAVIAGVSA